MKGCVILVIVGVILYVKNVILMLKKAGVQENMVHPSFFWGAKIGVVLICGIAAVLKPPQFFM